MEPGPAFPSPASSCSYSGLRHRLGIPEELSQPLFSALLNPTPSHLSSRRTDSALTPEGRKDFWFHFHGSSSLSPSS